jgi:hypothetical protein
MLIFELPISNIKFQIQNCIKREDLKSMLTFEVHNFKYQISNFKFAIRNFKSLKIYCNLNRFYTKPTYQKKTHEYRNFN